MVIKVTVRTKRIYDKKASSDGHRVLVDRIWPRGMSKEDADLDEWFKDIGPSDELRKWFDHDPDKFEEFSKKYREELQGGNQKASYDKLKEIQKNNSTITLLFGAKDEKHNQAVVLQEMLEGK